jgi:hypothetical protein
MANLRVSYEIQGDVGTVAGREDTSFEFAASMSLKPSS